MAERLTIRKPFDAHVHLRQDTMLRLVAPYTARQCFGGIVMPNTNPIIDLPEAALRYRDDILAASGDSFMPVMTGYLTESLDPADIERGFRMGAWKALKFYPRSKKHGAGTTNAHSGVTDLRNCTSQLAVMASIGMPLLLHGERIDDPATGDEVDPYDRESLFLKHDMPWLRETFPTLPMVLEHLSTTEGARFMKDHGEEGLLCATITAHHLALDRRDVMREGTSPIHGCKPPIKRESHKLALQGLISHGYPFIFAGTDSAPHPRSAKERPCGCADGVFTAHCATELYAQIFDQVDALDHLENFLSVNGPRFYGIEPSEERIILERSQWTQDGIIADSPTGTPGHEPVYPFGFNPDPKKRWVFDFKIVA